MSKETVLPKNIRQIGETQGEERIYLEDYVMTYIQKKEQKEQEGFLGVFLGESRKEEGLVYVFIRGILEVPAQEEHILEYLERQCRKYFPEWAVQGCCVIGQYQTDRMQSLGEALPESGRLIYHLQEQEESLYWTEGGRYRRLEGYLIFYEQNRQMQEYLADEFQESSVEKESLPDKAIKSFREKVREKGEEKNRVGMLKLAGSFFAVTVLVIGALLVNRADVLRGLRGQQEEGTAENEALGQITVSGSPAVAGGSSAVPGGVALSGSDSSETEGGVSADSASATADGASAVSGGAVSSGNGSTMSGGAVSSGNGSAMSGGAVSSGNGSAMSGDAVSSGNGSAMSGDAVSSDSVAVSSLISTDTADLTAQALGSSGGEVLEGSGASAVGSGAAEPGDAANAGGSAGNLEDGTADNDAETRKDSAASASEGASAEAPAASEGVPAEAPAASEDTSADASTATGEGSADASASTATGEGSADASASTVSWEEAAGAGDTSDGGVSSAEAAAPASAPVRRTRASYTIREGDTLADICNKYYGSLDRLTEICEANGIDDADLILPGQKIVLP